MIGHGSHGPYKRRLHHTLVRLRQVRYAYLLVALVAAATCFVFAYRGNNLTALQLRDQLLETDKNNGDVEAALRKLREYTYSHMNAGLSSQNGVYPPIQLKYRYERLLTEAKAKAQPRNDQQIATDAAAHCGVTAGVRNTCVQNYLEQRVTAQQPETSVPDALYKFDFVAPIWSPDVAGWSLVATILFALVLAVRFLSQRWLEHQIRNHG